MLAKILRYLFPCTIADIEATAKVAGITQAAMDLLPRMQLMWDISRIGKTKGLYTNRDYYMKMAMLGKIKNRGCILPGAINYIFDDPDKAKIAFPEG